MISKVLSTSLLFLIVNRTTADTISSSTETHSEVTTRSANRSDDESTTANANADQREWRPPSNEEYLRSASVGGGSGGRKVVSIDLATLNKYRRGDGVENLSEMDQQRRRYFENNQNYNHPEPHYHYENDGYQRGGGPMPPMPPPRMPPYELPPQHSRYHQPMYHRYPSQDEIYPVQVQGCSHLMRDVSRLQPPPATETPHRGILQGWLGGVDGEGGWRASNGFAGGGGMEEGKRYNPSTSQVTTATPKVAPAYRNRDYSKYEFGHDKTNDFRYRSKYGDEMKSNRVGSGGGGSDYYDQPNRESPDRNVPPWSSSPHRNRNTNRIVYYEYNLDDKLQSPPLATTDSRLRADWNHNDKCARGHNHIGLECEPDWFTASIPAARNTYHRFDNRRRFYTRDEYDRMNTVTPIASYTRHEYPTEAPAYHSAANAAGYVGGTADDSYRYRNSGGGRADTQNGVGIGYVYSLDLPMDRRRFGSPGAAYAADSGFMRPDDYRPESMTAQLEQQ